MHLFMNPHVDAVYANVFCICGACVLVCAHGAFDEIFLWQEISSRSGSQSTFSHGEAETL